MVNNKTFDRIVVTPVHHAAASRAAAVRCGYPGPHRWGGE